MCVRVGPGAVTLFSPSSLPPSASHTIRKKLVSWLKTQTLGQRVLGSNLSSNSTIPVTDGVCLIRSWGPSMGECRQNSERCLAQGRGAPHRAGVPCGLAEGFSTVSRQPGLCDQGVTHGVCTTAFSSLVCVLPHFAEIKSELTGKGLVVPGTQWALYKPRCFPRVWRQHPLAQCWAHCGSSTTERRG